MTLTSVHVMSFTYFEPGRMTNKWQQSCTKIWTSNIFIRARIRLNKLAEQTTQLPTISFVQDGEELVTGALPLRPKLFVQRAPFLSNDDEPGPPILWMRHAFDSSHLPAHQSLQLLTAVRSGAVRQSRETSAGNLAVGGACNRGRTM